MKPVYIIAEAGVNHNGEADLAFKLVDAAVDAGADAVKFQTFTAEKLITKTAAKAKYQNETTDESESQYEMLKRLELNQSDHYELQAYCKEKGIEFLSTAFDEDSLKFLHHQLGLTKLKIPSGELTNAPLVLAHARTGSDLIVSTGMTNIEDIEKTLGIIAYGFLHSTDQQIPGEKLFAQSYASPEGRSLLKEKVTLLHCTSEYPAPFEEINLKAMESMSRLFGLAVGYSDHSLGLTIPIAATACGATVIEKHFTLDSTMEGPDHRASLEPVELAAMVKAIREVSTAMGDGTKKVTPSEIENQKVARKSIVAAKDILKGEKYSEENLCIMRPEGGLPPIHYWNILGTVAQSSSRKGDLIND